MESNRLINVLNDANSSNNAVRQPATEQLEALLTSPREEYLQTILALVPVVEHSAAMVALSLSSTLLEKLTQTGISDNVWRTIDIAALIQAIQTEPQANYTGKIMGQIAVLNSAANSEYLNLIFTLYTNKAGSDRCLLQLMKVYFKYYETNFSSRSTENTPFYLSLLNDLQNRVNSYSQGDSAQLEAIVLIGKIFKGCLLFIGSEQINPLVQTSFVFLHFTLDTPSSLNSLSAVGIYIFTQILIRHTNYSDSLKLRDLQAFVGLFNSFLANPNLFSQVISFVAESTEEPSKIQEKLKNSILDFFNELLFLTSGTSFQANKIFRNLLSDDALEISDYLTAEYFNENTLTALLNFILTNMISLKQEFFSSAEEFYFWYDSIHYSQDSLSKALKLFSSVYSKFTEEIKMFPDSLIANFLQTDRKKEILACFEAISLQYFSREVDLDSWRKAVIETIFTVGDEIEQFLLSRVFLKGIGFSAKINSIALEMFDFFVSSKSLGALSKIGSYDFVYHVVDEELDFSKGEPLIQFLLDSNADLCSFSSPDILLKVTKMQNILLIGFSPREAADLLNAILRQIRYLWAVPQNELLFGKRNLLIWLQKCISKADLSLVSEESLSFIPSLIEFCWSTSKNERELLLAETVKLTVVTVDCLAEHCSVSEVRRVNLADCGIKGTILSNLFNTINFNIQVLLETSEFFLLYLLNIENLLCMNVICSEQFLNNNSNTFSLLLDRLSREIKFSRIIFYFFELCCLIFPSEQLRDLIELKVFEMLSNTAELTPEQQADLYFCSLDLVNCAKLSHNQLQSLLEKQKSISASSVNFIHKEAFLAFSNRLPSNFHSICLEIGSLFQKSKNIAYPSENKALKHKLFRMNRYFACRYFAELSSAEGFDRERWLKRLSECSFLESKLEELRFNPKTAVLDY